MALKTFKPYTKSTRGTILVDRSGLWKGKPFKSLVSPKNSATYELLGLLYKSFGVPDWTMLPFLSIIYIVSFVIINVLNDFRITILPLREFWIFLKHDKSNGFFIENSWGKDKGDNGNYYMSLDWAKKYIYEIVVDKKFLSDKILNVLNKKPIVLPYWSPFGNVL